MLQDLLGDAVALIDDEPQERFDADAVDTVSTRMDAKLLKFSTGVATLLVSDSSEPPESIRDLQPLACSTVLPQAPRGRAFEMSLIHVKESNRNPSAHLSTITKTI